VLHRASQEASDIVLAPASDSQERFVGLRRYLLEFAVDGYFTEVSRREAIHRYYRLCQDALNVPNALDNTRRAVADIDARNTAERQIRIAEDLRTNAEATRGMQKRMNENIALVAKAQTMVEWIEIFIVSVYLAHLWETFASHVEALHEWVAHGVLIAATVGGIVTALVLKPWRHRQHELDEIGEGKLSSVDWQQSEHSVPGKTEHEKTGNQRATAESRRRFFVALLFAAIFIASIATLLVTYKSSVTGDVSRVPLSSNVAIWINVLIALASAIAASLTVIGWRSERIRKRKSRS
jgi:hypothetical protein